MSPRNYNIHLLENNLENFLSEIENSKQIFIKDFLNKFYLNAQFFIDMDETREISKDIMLKCLNQSTSQYLFNSGNENIVSLTKNNRLKTGFIPYDINLINKEIIGYSIHNNQITNENYNLLEIFLKNFNQLGQKIIFKENKTLNINSFMNNFFYTSPENIELNKRIARKLITQKYKIKNETLSLF